jgi:hypothetical protein
MITRTIFLGFIFLLTSSFVGNEIDLLYKNYTAALNNNGTFQYFLVVKVKDVKLGTIGEYCTKGNFLKGAIHMEYHQKYNEVGIDKVHSLAMNNKDRYFEFKNRKAIANISGWPYSIEELAQFEKTINIDSLVNEIKMSKGWSKEILNEKTKLMYAHSLFNHGVLTGENSCFGGRIVYVDSYKKD